MTDSPKPRASPVRRRKHPPHLGKGASAPGHRWVEVLGAGEERGPSRPRRRPRAARRPARAAGAPRSSAWPTTRSMHPDGGPPEGGGCRRAARREADRGGGRCAHCRLGGLHQGVLERRQREQGKGRCAEEPRECAAETTSVTCQSQPTAPCRMRPDAARAAPGSQVQSAQPQSTKTRRVMAAHSAAKPSQAGTRSTSCAARTGKVAPRNRSSGPLSRGSSGVSSMEGGGHGPQPLLYARPCMSLDRAPTEDEVVTSADALIDVFRSAERPRAEHRVGLEHEKFLYPVEDPPRAGAVRGSARHRGAAAGCSRREGYAPFRDAPDAPPIALTRDEHTLSLEPGGQFELSGTPARTARAVHAENVAHARMLTEAAAQLGLVPVTLGYRPWGTTADMPWMPKKRYQMMRQTLPGPREARAGHDADDLHRAGLARLGVRGGLRAEGDRDRAADAAPGGAVRQQPAGAGPAERAG